MLFGNPHSKDCRIVGKGTLLGTPNWEPQEYSRYIIGIYLPGSLYSIVFLLYSWGSQFGVPSRVPLVGNISLNPKPEVLDFGDGSWAGFLGFRV